MWKKAAALAAGAALIGGCSLLSQGGAKGESVGEVVIHLSEERDPRVGEIHLPEPLLFRSEEEWSAWYEETIPAGLRIGEEPRFDGSVAVAGSFPRCQEYSVLTHSGAELSFTIRKPEEHVDCYWSPNQVVVYEVTVADLGADDPSEVTLNPDYVRQ